MPDLYYGKYTGIVKDNSDAEKLGQLQVVVPAIFPPDEVIKARAALPYGFFFVPEIQAKVWIEFEGGDTGLPLWTGVQYVAGEWPPEAQAIPPSHRVIKTASGHLVTFDDTSGAEKIDVRDASGQAITLDANGVSIQAVGGAKAELTSSGITLQAAAGAKVELTPTGVAVDAGATSVTVTGTAIRLGAGSLPVVRLSDSGIGNLGAPVVMTVSSNSQVFA
jgi:hypothetical protein